MIRKKSYLNIQKLTLYFINIYKYITCNYWYN